MTDTRPPGASGVAAAAGSRTSTSLPRSGSAAPITNWTWSPGNVAVNRHPDSAALLSLAIVYLPMMPPDQCSTSRNVTATNPGAAPGDVVATGTVAAMVGN